MKLKDPPLLVATCFAALVLGACSERERADAAPPAAISAETPTTGSAAACEGADTQLTDDHASRYAVLVADAMDVEVEPEEVAIHRIMVIDGWSTVHASTPVADPAHFVFEHVGGEPRFRDVWGGMADEGDRDGIADWARALGAVEEFAACFAETVID